MEPILSHLEGNRFQYRKRYEVTCDIETADCSNRWSWSSNTASGMRSHVTANLIRDIELIVEFQYRKRYEVTCDFDETDLVFNLFSVPIPQAV